jgi:hypothetical protein
MSKPEPLTAASLQKKAIPSCSKCGSCLVLTEAFVKWNERLQRWDIHDLFVNNAVCDNCGQDTEIKWRLEK